MANFLNGQETNHIWQVSMSASKTPLIPVELSIKHAYQDLLICLSITSHGQYSQRYLIWTPISIHEVSHGEGIFGYLFEYFCAFNGALVRAELVWLRAIKKLGMKS